MTYLLDTTTFSALMRRDTKVRARVAALAPTDRDENDLWIAVTARALEAVVVTTDSDFQRVSGLQIEDWTQ